MDHLGPLEMQVMTALREKAPAGVQEILDRLSDSGTELAYTTVLTVLSRLHEKGVLVREREGRRYLYAPAKRAEGGRSGFLNRVRGALFGSERLAPVVALLDAGDGLNAAELEELKLLVEGRIAERAVKKGKRG